MAEEDGKAKRWEVTHIPGKEETGDSTGKFKKPKIVVIKIM